MAGLSSTRIVWRGPTITSAVRAAAAVGANRAAERLLALAVPLTPYLEGDLVKSYGIHEATAETVEQGAQVQNSSKYAKRQHEELDWKHTLDPHPAAQAKFLEQPLADNRAELYAIMAATIAAGL